MSIAIHISCAVPVLSDPVVAQANSRRKAEKLAAAKALDLIQENSTDDK